jgi:hypothetical protein
VTGLGYQGGGGSYFLLYKSYVTDYSWLQDTHHNLIDTLANTNIIQAASKETGKTTRPAPWFQQLSSIYTRPFGTSGLCGQAMVEQTIASKNSHQEMNLQFQVTAFVRNKQKAYSLVLKKLANNGRAIYQVGDVYSVNKEVADAAYKTDAIISGCLSSCTYPHNQMSTLK